VCVCLCVFVLACMRACMRACVRVRARACVSVKKLIYFSLCSVKKMKVHGSH